MAALSFCAGGCLVSDAGRLAFIFRPGDRPYSLRLGFILRGSEEVILPESLLDDWGHEIATTELYAWVRENGPHFPRAEIFGYDSEGRSKQAYIREVDLMASYVCYAFDSADAPLSTGARLDAILLPMAGVVLPRRLASSRGIAAPLSGADVQWWAVQESADDTLKLAFLEDANDFRGR